MKKIFFTLFFLITVGVCYSQVSKVPVYIKTYAVPDTNKSVIFTPSTATPLVGKVYSSPQIVNSKFVGNYLIIIDSCFVSEPLISKKSITPIQINTK